MRKDEDFLEDLKTEILEGDKVEVNEKDRRLKSKVSWESLVIKREITIGLQDSEVGAENTDPEERRERLQKMLEDKRALTEDSLSCCFPGQNIFVHPEEGFGFVSDKPTLSMTISRSKPFHGETKVGKKLYCYFL